MSSATLLINGVPVPVNGTQVTPGSVVSVALADSTGVGTWQLACYDGDAATHPIAITAGITIDPVTFTATLTFPSGGFPVGLPRTASLVSIINGGLGPDGAYSSSSVAFADVFSASIDHPKIPPTGGRVGPSFIARVVASVGNSYDFLLDNDPDAASATAAYAHSSGLPAAETWTRASDGSKLKDTTTTYSGGLPSTLVTRVFAADGATVVAQKTETLTWSGGVPTVNAMTRDV